MGITRAATTAITAVIHLTERLTTVDGRTTTAIIASTSIVSTITTANNKAYQVGVRLSSWLGAIPSQLFFRHVKSFQ